MSIRETGPDQIDATPGTHARPTGVSTGGSVSDRPRLLLGTLIVLAFVCNMLGRGVTETFAVFLLPVEQAFDVTRAEVTATYSIYMLVHGLSAPFAGQLIDRLGARFTYATGLLLLGGGYVLGASVDALPHYYLAVGVMPGLGAACLGMVAATSLLSRWWTKGLGMAMAVPYAAVGVGLLIIPPLTQWLIAAMDWRAAHAAIGWTTLAVVPILFVLPLGRITAGSDDWQAQRKAGLESGGLWTVSRAIRTPAFWALFSCYFWTAVSAYAVIPQSVAFLVERGFDPLIAAGALGLTGGLSAIGIVAMGWLSDRFGRMNSVAVSYAISVTGIASLLAIVWVPEMIFVYGFVFCFGLMQGVRGPVIAALVAILYRGGSVGGIFGAMSVALGFGAGLGSWASGWLHDITGDYIASFGMAIAASLLGLVSFAMSASVRQERVIARSV